MEISNFEISEKFREYEEEILVVENRVLFLVKENSDLKKNNFQLKKKL